MIDELVTDILVALDSKIDGEVEEHDESNTAHSDLRQMLETLQSALTWGLD